MDSFGRSVKRSRDGGDKYDNHRGPVPVQGRNSNAGRGGYGTRGDWENRRGPLTVLNCIELKLKYYVL